MWYLTKTVKYTGCGIPSKQLKFGKREVKLWDICYIEVLNQLLLYKPCLYKECSHVSLRFVSTRLHYILVCLSLAVTYFTNLGWESYIIKYVIQFFIVNASSIQQLTLTIVWLWQIKNGDFRIWHKIMELAQTGFEKLEPQNKYKQHWYYK